MESDKKKERGERDGKIKSRGNEERERERERDRKRKKEVRGEV